MPLRRYCGGRFSDQRDKFVEESAPAPPMHHSVSTGAFGRRSRSAVIRPWYSCGLALACLLACILTPRASHALSCIRATPIDVVVAAICTDGVCNEAMALRQHAYRHRWCTTLSRPVISNPEDRWLTIPEIAERLGGDGTSGLFIIRTSEGCLRDMARRNPPSWTQTRARECRLQSSVVLTAGPPAADAFTQLRSDWRAKQMYGLVAALPVIIIGSDAVKLATILMTIVAIILPWVLARRAGWAPGRTTAVFSASIGAQVVICVAVIANVRLGPDFYNGGGGPIGLWITALCMLMLVFAIAIEFGFLFIRWSWRDVPSRKTRDARI